MFENLIPLCNNRWILRDDNVEYFGRFRLDSTSSHMCVLTQSHFIHSASYLTVDDCIEMYKKNNGIIVVEHDIPTKKQAFICKIKRNDGAQDNSFIIKYLIDIVEYSWCWDDWEFRKSLVDSEFIIDE